jgi:hypothetical protein
MVRSADPLTAAAEGPEAVMNFVFYSVYFDKLVKIDGAWRFAHRACQPIYLESGGLTGQVCVPRSTLARRG